MSRKIYCINCGKIRPTPPEDAAMGLFQRYKRGASLRSMVCDLCGVDIDVGMQCVAWSQPDTIAEWESEYIAQAQEAKR